MAGEAREAIESIRRMLSQQRLGDAETACRAILAATPDDVEVLELLGAAVMMQDRPTAMDELALAGVKQLGESLLHDNQPDPAEAALSRAAQRAPDDVAAVFNHGTALELQGRCIAAVERYDRAYQLRPREDTRLLAATRLPMVYQSVEELESYRSRLRENLARLAGQGFRLNVERLPVPNLFLLAYQGQNDRDILRDHATLIAPPPSPPISQRKRDGRIRVGFVSMYLKSHTIGRINKGLIAQLDRDAFHVTVFSLGQYDDDDARFIRERADEYVETPRTLPEARSTIAARGVDVLNYTDIGMDNVTWTLAFSRLAPVQCVTWGHPSTTGNPNVDYYISSDLLESPSADEHYTEKLVRLPNLSVYYYKPTTPQPAPDRRAFGFPDGVNVYGCLQSIFKLHPENDAVLDELLKRDPNGVVLIPHGPSRHWAQQLATRMSRTMPQTVGRVKFSDPLPYEQYLALSAACDVLLAPIHFGAGNTSYEAFAFGTPTVTLPSEFLKGRITYGLYKAMGVTDCVATSPRHYAELAAKLGTDREFNRHVREKILANNHVLYENPAGVRDFENFLQSVAPRR